MPFFHPDNRNRSAEHQRIYAAFEIAYTVVDFLAAMSFFVGSVMFFYEAPIKTIGIWLFVIGSLLFAVKPSIRLVRELRYASMGDTEDLAEKLKT